jgi:hypothetical protein
MTIDRLDGRTLDAELEWLARAIEFRLQHYFAKDAPASPPLPGELAPPKLDARSGGAYAACVLRHGLEPAERLLVALALAPHLRPQLLDVLATRNDATQRAFTEFGGVLSPAGSVLPTGETACFLLAGDDMPLRLDAMRRLAPDPPRARHEKLQRASPTTPESPAAAPNSTPLGGVLTLSPRFLVDALPGLGVLNPVAGAALATRVRTGLAWSDLVLPATTLAQLDDIALWLTHGPKLLHEWGLGKRIAPGYVSLFHGPPGAGKTLSACLLGQRCGREVHRVDLSLVVSKYIGETEKNLARLFDAAERQGWILFFDEADALFGKRTGVSDAHDRYANQEVSYLLQRIEGFAGAVILASNLRQQIDDAFLRRFQSVVQFPLPKAPERLRLWREALPAPAQWADDLDLNRLAQQHELSGGTIMNVLRYACLHAVARDQPVVRADDVAEGVRRELLKEGRTP